MCIASQKTFLANSQNTVFVDFSLFLCDRTHLPFCRYLGIDVVAQACRAVRRMCLQFWIVHPISVLYRTLRADGSRNDLGVRLALLCSPACDRVPLLRFRTLATEAGISNETWGIMGPIPDR